VLFACLGKPVFANNKIVSIIKNPDKYVHKASLSEGQKPSYKKIHGRIKEVMLR
jgi:hypothetical protein